MVFYRKLQILIVYLPYNSPRCRPGSSWCCRPRSGSLPQQCRPQVLAAIRLSWAHFPRHLCQDSHHRCTPMSTNFRRMPKRGCALTHTGFSRYCALGIVAGHQRSQASLAFLFRLVHRHQDLKIIVKISWLGKCWHKSIGHPGVEKTIFW